MTRRTKIAIAMGALALLAGVGLVLFRCFAPQQTRRVDQPSEAVNTAAIKRGTFQGADAVHQVSGSVALHETGDGLRLLFQNYEATSGPDVFFYLAGEGDFDESTALRVPVPGGVGDGQATLRGNFAVPLAAGFDAETHTRLVVWCKRFGVRFGEAALE